MGPARIGRALFPINNDTGSDDAGAGLQLGCETTSHAEAYESLAARRHCTRERSFEMLPVAAAHHRNTESRCDASLEGHPHHYDHSAAPPQGRYIPKDTTRLFPLVRLRYLAIAHSGKNLRYP